MQKIIKKYLEQNKKFHAEYTNAHMSSHLPMALIALFKMGASEQKLDDFYKRYSRRLKEKPADTLQITKSNWQDHLGTHNHNKAYQDFFTKEVADLGVEQCLKTYLPDLMPGLSGGAFHPMIRLSYALDMDHEGEVVEALSAWAIAYLPLPEMTDQKSDIKENAGIAEILDHIANDDVLNADIVEGNNISGKIDKISQKSVFQKHLNNIQMTDPKILDDISDKMAHLFDKTRGFTVLHGLTSAQAMRDMLPYLNQKDTSKALTTYVRAAMAAYVSVGSPKLEISIPKAPEQTKSWSEIFNKAVAFDDDHKIKLVYSCYKENMRQNFNQAAQKPDQKQPAKADIYYKIAHDFTFPKK